MTDYFKKIVLISFITTVILITLSYFIAIVGYMTLGTISIVPAFIVAITFLSLLGVVCFVIVMLMLSFAKFIIKDININYNQEDIFDVFSFSIVWYLHIIIFAFKMYKKVIEL